MALNLPAGMQITAPVKPEWESILTTEALEFVAKLHRAFEPRRPQLERSQPSRHAADQGTHLLHAPRARCEHLEPHSHLHRRELSARAIDDPVLQP